MQLVPHPLALGDDLIEHFAPLGLFLFIYIFILVVVAEIDAWFEVFIPKLCCCDGFFPDVPDAPENLVLSERKGKSVKLKWIPGDDHNSSTTGKKKEHPCVEVSYKQDKHESVHP